MHTNLTRGHTPVFALRMSKMTVSEKRDLVLKMMKDAGFDTDYERYAQKASQVVPKHLWMLCRIYTSGKKNNNQEMWKFALFSLMDEGYLLVPKSGMDDSNGITLIPLCNGQLPGTAFMVR
jgi:hypothetical protein